MPIRLLGMVILLAVTSNIIGAPHWEDLSSVRPASTSAYDKGIYSDCILKNTKVAGLSPRVLAQIMDACETKATPKLCRGYVKKPWEEYGGTNECIAKCKAAGWWSRKYGECSTD